MSYFKEGEQLVDSHIWLIDSSIVIYVLCSLCHKLPTRNSEVWSLDFPLHLSFLDKSLVKQISSSGLVGRERVHQQARVALRHAQPGREYGGGGD